MKCELTHKLEFTAAAPPMLSELQGMVETALRDGFPATTPVYIRVSVDEETGKGYTFYAVIGRPEDALG